MLQLKRHDERAYAEMCKSKASRDEIYKKISEVITAENKLSSIFRESEAEGNSEFKGSMKAMIDALQFETFLLNVKRETGKDALVTCTRAGKPFLQDIQLLTTYDTETATDRQGASLVLEITVVLLSLVNVNISLTTKETEEAIKELLPTMKRIADALQNLANAWKHNTDISSRTQALFAFIKQIYNVGVLMAAVRTVIQFLPWMERLIAIGRVLAFIRTVCRNPKSILERIKKVLMEAGKVFLQKIMTVVAISEVREFLDPNYIL